MSQRVFIVLVILGIVMAGAAVVVQQRERSTTAPGQLGQPLLKGLKAADVASIAIREPKASLTLEKKGERWMLAERSGFPADAQRVTEFVIKAIGLRVGQSEPLGEKDRARLELAEPGSEGAGTLVEYRGADGKPLARLLIGKKYFKREPENPARAIADGRFVLLPEDPKTVYTISDAMQSATAKTEEWVAKEGVSIERVKSLQVAHADGESWKFERATDGPEWTLAGAKAGEKLEMTRANAASYSLNGLSIEDIAASAKPEDHGLDKPTLVTATTFDGLTYVLQVGKLAGDRYPVRVQVEGALAAPSASADKPAADKDAKPAAPNPGKDAARLERERALKDYVLLVGKSKLNDTLVRRSGLLEQKKEDGKK